ncbi:MAG: 4Fe-4S binding protein [Lachnospiraceae bacterium]|nr:4Fe-4S binding protein [Lachnospiraceae bacterium]MDD3614925.1 4Fe-4S binding protein [Lachnospiraceae bacterium]
MKKLVVTDKDACKACLACEIACSEAFYKEFNPDYSCIHIEDKNGSVKTTVCIQCGKCMRECPEGAISQNAKGTYVIDKKKCVACGKCVEVCPMHVMVLKEGAANATKCIACGICAKACPMGILEVQDK